METRLTAPWRPWEAVPVAIGAFVAAVILSVGIVAIAGGVGGIAMLLSTLALQLSVLGFTFGWVALRYPGSTPAMRLHSDRTAPDVVVGAWTGGLLFLLTAFALYPALNLLVEGVTGRAPAPVNQLPFGFTTSTVVLGVLVVILFAPLSEEVFFRGFLYTSLRARLSFWPAAAISALVFGGFHMSVSWVLLPLMFVVGLGLAFLFERRSSLVAPIAAHAAFNLIGYALIVMERT